MKQLLTTTLLALILLPTCTVDHSAKIASWQEEIRQTEEAFSVMAEAEGIPVAFLHFADEQAVLNRNDSLIIGISNIRQRFKGLPAAIGQLSWKPEFVEVAESGDLAYTYGYYTFVQEDSLGKKLTQRGVFHTVWKRQGDGSWKFVWD